jgi:hypothetical protein
MNGIQNNRVVGKAEEERIFDIFHHFMLFLLQLQPPPPVVVVVLFATSSLLFGQMASGYGISGNVSRCYKDWRELTLCASSGASRHECAPFFVAYTECLYRHEEVCTCLVTLPPPPPPTTTTTTTATTTTTNHIARKKHLYKK